VDTYALTPWQESGGGFTPLRGGSSDWFAREPALSSSVPDHWLPNPSDAQGYLTGQRDGPIPKYRPGGQMHGKPGD
jgi:hypothetical protein